MAQTFTDWEAICVDDGSTDGSGAILDEYAAKDKRFRVIHQANAGVSAARNEALNVVRSEWFLYLDGDDILREDGLELFLPYIKTGDCDGVLVHPYIPYWRGGVIPVRIVRPKLLVEKASAEDLVFGPYAANGFTISRVYKRCVFGHLRFPVGVTMAEDVYYWFDVLSEPAKWKIINAEYYLYRQREDSVCGKKSPRDCESVLNSVLYACSRISDRMGLGQEGVRRYIKRWSFSPCKYLNIFVARYKALDKDTRSEVLAKVAAITNLSGEWPFTWGLRCKLWLVKHRMAFLLPIVHIVEFVNKVLSRGMKLLRHVHTGCFAFVFGKVKRLILRQGECAVR